MPLLQVCNTYVMNERGDVLLGRKKTGFGKGRTVGLGGKLDRGEHPRDAAIREVEEESTLRIRPENLELVGYLTYYFPGRPEWTQESWLFRTATFEGEPRETDEIEPAWWPPAEIPFDEMWPDARLVLPRALAGDFVRASFAFANDGALIAGDLADAGLPPLTPDLVARAVG